MTGTDPQTPWQDKPRLNTATILGIVAVLAVIYSAPVLVPERRTDVWRNLTRFVGEFFPPDFSVLPDTFEALGETFQIAVMATLFAIVLAFPLGLAGAQNIAPRALVWLTRLLLNITRTVPGLIWALLGVAIVGATPLAGVIGLTFYSLGYLGKFFSDAFESVDIEVARGMRATGASRWQAFQYGLWPNARPLLVSYALWMLEYNIRSASIIGFVGAGGIGLRLHIFQEYRQWDKFAAVLLVLLVIVSLLDFANERLRKEMTRRTTPQPPAQ